jgi:hypothetical protein
VSRLPHVHELKIWPEYFAAVVDGSKPFEVRANDRKFAVDDYLELREWNPESKSYTGRSTFRQITYIGTGIGLAPGYVVLGVRVWTE